MGIRKRLFLQHLFIISMTVCLFEGIFFYGLYSYYYDGTTEMLKNHAANSAQFANRYMDISPYNLRQTIPKMRNNFEIPQAEMQVLSTNGNVLISSTGFSTNEKILTPDVKKAINDQNGDWKGHNVKTNERIVAVSVPIKDNNRVLGVLRFVSSLNQIDVEVRKLTLIAISIGAGVILLVMLFSIGLASTITKPLKQLTSASKKMAKGDFQTKINEQYVGEFGVLAKSFNNMGQELLNHEKMKNQFISSVSHELRTPLTSIKGWSETLLTGNLEDTEETRTGIKIVSSEAERLIGLVEELLDFSRFTNDTMKIQKQHFNFCTLIQNIVLQLEKQASRKKLHIQIESSEDCEIKADPNRIRQVCINLLDNAIKYSNEPGTINIRFKKSAHTFHCEIEDEGIGIDQNELPNLKKMFYKINESSSGAGLGLSICQYIIEHHQGNLEFKSKKEKGTTVSFTIPL
ncbi:sensor histidine kinase [Falsibacillus albus]|uniref:histidine kinase n=1 Tax=Falsibacillus albus TaxID=2478915 RepID=A0A3L7JYM2_9BACI|nr:HAMP domain-containing sensor histidine kinase [Falsibacillus albus]RLQ95354.1 sensor histidine kinase [Falsibacillus albus]